VTQQTTCAGGRPQITAAPNSARLRLRIAFLTCFLDDDDDAGCAAGLVGGHATFSSFREGKACRRLEAWPQPAEAPLIGMVDLELSLSLSEEQHATVWTLNPSVPACRLLHGARIRGAGRKEE
jgi:hypothetical protein